MYSYKWTVRSRVAAGFCALLFLACSNEKDQGSAQEDPVDSGYRDANISETDQGVDQKNGDSDRVVDDPSPGLQGGCDSSKEIGLFELKIGKSNSSITGYVQDAVLPGAVQIEVADFGSCKLSRQNKPSCDPICTMDLTCSGDNQCIPTPANQNVGTVTVSGLAEDVEMEPTPPSYLYFNSSLQGSVAEPGAPVQLVATGGDMSGFTLSGKGVMPLVATDAIWNVVEGQPTTIRWEPDSVSGATVMVRFGLDLHGSSRAQLVCEVEDTGSLVIPAEQIEQLIALGVSVPEKGKIERHTVDSVQIDQGCIEFSVYSRVSAEVLFSQSAP